MHRKTVTVTAPHGIHTRPAALLVKAAQQYACDILVECGGRRASAKSLFRLQTLALSQGAEVTVSAQGDGAEQAVEAIAAMLQELH
ncbi:HPr family phosphocarrier protein [Ferrimonas balearica]|uniref:HPr family phosphocarrier protein n=1 Tax=Ferrimonas balearica TaxID=44012 RepID=UPI001C99BD8E|nr:HPr family phosphocarrier protein [Ferrimonas balearica]MBY5922302.1 HPr family phosphocarrier protein [Ferrimonas balearica]MBY5994358.1 HPr family phosphocarrier protein [Ferrimonas balearica]